MKVVQLISIDGDMYLTNVQHKVHVARNILILVISYDMLCLPRRKISQIMDAMTEPDCETMLGGLAA